MLGKLTSPQIEDVLNSQLVGRIGCHANGVTYIVPTSYAYDGKYVYGHSKPGMKLDMMRKNPNICFEVEAYSDMANWKTVITWGIFEEIVESVERSAALDTLLHRTLPIVTSQTVQLSPNWPFKPTNLNCIEGVLFRIDLREKTGRFESVEASQIPVHNFH